MFIDIGQYKNKSVYFDTDAALNKHMLLLGKSGSGKTVEAQKILSEIVRNGGTAIAFDLHQTLAADQIFWKHKPVFDTYTNDLDVYKDGIQCNLLKPIACKDCAPEQDADMIEAVVDVLSRTFALQSRQQATLRTAIEFVVAENTYETEGMNAIGKALKNISTAVSETVAGKLHPLFMHNTFHAGNWPVKKGKLNILRISRFSLGTQEVIAELILSYIWRLAVAGYFGQGGLYLFVDECQNLSLGKNSALTQILSEGRKFNVNLILATQIFSQENSKLSMTQQRLAQCGLILYFQPDASSVRTIAKMIEPYVANEWTKMLRFLKQGEFIATGTLNLNGRRVDQPLKVSAFEKV